MAQPVPDIVSQVLMAVPLILLYELSIVIAKIFGKKREKLDENDEADSTEESEEKPPEE